MNSVNGISGIDRDSLSCSAIGVANRREMVDRTERESARWDREGENGRDIRGEAEMTGWYAENEQ